MKKLMLAAIAALSLGIGVANAAQTHPQQNPQTDPSLLMGGGN